MLISETLFGVRDKVQEAIDLLKKHEPPEGYYLAFSGGKDSVAIYELAEVAGVKFDAHYNLTTVDPPELVQFIKREYPQVEIHRPIMTMWQLIHTGKKFPSTRRIRECCLVLKEHGGDGRVIVMGLRAEESPRRAKKWDLVSEFKKTKSKRGAFKKIINPIFHWAEDEVWDFIEREDLKYCVLYDDPGYSRLGCVLCPMSNKIKRQYELQRYPKIAAAYVRAFDRMLINRKRAGLQTKWRTGQEVMDWWLSQ